MEFKRKCPTCDSVKIYRGKDAFVAAEKKNARCHRCVYYDKLGKMDLSGAGNPMYGKKHTDEAKRKLVENRDNSYLHTEEHKSKARENLKKNGNRVHAFDIWKEKFGEDIANLKMDELRKKQSVNSSGENNPMYGKPPPVGAGAGWSGWFHGKFFRSLRELSFMLEIYNAGIEWINGELDIYRVDYIVNGKKSTYRPDFIVGNVVYEIKPKALQKTRIVLLKKEAAEKHFAELGMKYVVIDCKVIVPLDLISLINSNAVILTEKWKKKLPEYLKSKGIVMPE